MTAVRTASPDCDDAFVHFQEVSMHPVSSCKTGLSAPESLMDCSLTWTQVSRSTSVVRLKPLEEKLTENIV